MSTRLVVALGVAALTCYALKVWLLNLFLDLSGAGLAPSELLNSAAGGAFGDSLSPSASAMEDLLDAGELGEAYVSAAIALREGDYERAIEELAVCGGIAEGRCLYLSGEMHLVGAGVPRNLSEAVRLFAASADRGDPDSQYALGVLHANLFDDTAGLRRNEAFSVLYLYAASVGGHTGALMAMGYRHSEGQGVPKRCETAALNYIAVARRVADVYSAGMPQAVELVRLGVDGNDGRRAMSASEVTLFVELAASGDASIAAAVGKRYLLGTEGFQQNYQHAAHHLQLAADKNHGGAMALLGYMYCLGLGVAKSLDVSYSYFMSSAVQGDALGHNGLGYIYFRGTEVQEQDLKLAFKHFNESAYGGSADGMFNLGSLYLSGMGVEQSFQKATLWYTQALGRGHTPAAYTLALMHLNGIGTAQNCKIAVDLLKRVCERGSWVSRKLQEAYDHKEAARVEGAAWLYLRLAEAGHELAQVNLAHVLDSGESHLLHSSAVDETTEDARAFKRIYAQRHYEMSAMQGNALSDLRLGDFAYYGWGLRVEEALEDNNGEDVSAEAAVEQALAAADEVRFVRQEPDAGLSLLHYRRTAEMRMTAEWMQPFVARASFNLGYMYQFGVGAARDLGVARQYYTRCVDTDPAGVQLPVFVMSALLAVQAAMAAVPTPGVAAASLAYDFRTHLVAVQLVVLVALLRLRGRFAGNGVRDDDLGLGRVAAWLGFGN